MQQQVKTPAQEDKVGKNDMTPRNYIINRIRENANDVMVAFANSEEGVIVGDYYFDDDREALTESISEAYGEVISSEDDRHSEIAEKVFGGEIYSDIYAFCNPSDVNRTDGFNIFFATI